MKTLSATPLHPEAPCSISSFEQTRKSFLPRCHVTHNLLGLWSPLSRSHDTSHFITLLGRMSPLPHSGTHLKQPIGGYVLSYVGLVYSWEWTFGAGMLSWKMLCWLLPNASLWTGKGRTPWTLHMFLSFIVIPGLYSTLLTLTSCSWWCYHLMVKDNCSMFWFYIWVWSLAPLDTISF